MRSQKQHIVELSGRRGLVYAVLSITGEREGRKDFVLALSSNESRKEGGGGKCSISDAPKQLPCVCSGIYMWPCLWWVRWVKLDLPHWKSSGTAESSLKKKSDIPATLKTEKAELWLSGHLFPEVGVWKAVARFLKSRNSRSKFRRWLLGVSSRVWAHKTVLFCLGLKKQQHMHTHFSYCVKWIVWCQFYDHGLPGIEMSLFRQNLNS